MSKNIITSLILIMLSCFENTVFGAQKVNFNEDKSITFDVSKQHMNRIEIKGDYPSEVVGDVSKYAIIKDRIGKNLFLSLKGFKKEKFNISLITTLGKACDIIICPKDISSQSLIIDFSTKDNVCSNDHEIASMLRCMKSSICGKYGSVANLLLN